MKHRLAVVAAGILLLSSWSAQAETTVLADHVNNDNATPEFAFKTVPSPSPNDAATAARFTLVDGTPDQNSGGLDKLHDGGLPGSEDRPAENFFFRAGTDGGRLQVDLGKAVTIRQINSYSWHPGTRGPQVYKLYASNGKADDFKAAPKTGTDPEQCGWKFIAAVDTEPKSGEGGGQYGVSIFNPDGNLGDFQYLLFDIKAIEHDDPFGNTFYSEIDVVDTNALVVARSVPSGVFTFKTADGKCTITLNTAQAQALREWAEHTLAPALAEWYPKIVALLPSPGYAAPTHFSITLKPMDGVAFTSGHRVVANSDWLQKEIGGEAVGSLVHEMVHVVQQFGHNGVHNPGWLVEGSADYIRWFKYEPQSHGADIVWMRHLHHFSPHYNDSYRVTANFLNWISEKYDADIVGQMNAAMREGKYDDGLWKKYTGKTAPELGAEWKKDVETRLAATEASNQPN
ncbi:MAG TPA: basic secretory protein-like protein [Candidatus Binatia bacterium]|nr:basic secretory protein-like protein [Candidatus Binatia bacterium]